MDLMFFSCFRLDYFSNTNIAWQTEEELVCHMIREWTGYNYVQAKCAAQDRTAWRCTKKSADVVANRQK